MSNFGRTKLLFAKSFVRSAITYAYIELLACSLHYAKYWLSWRVCVWSCQPILPLNAALVHTY